MYSWTFVSFVSLVVNLSCGACGGGGVGPFPSAPSPQPLYPAHAVPRRNPLPVPRLFRRARPRGDSVRASGAAERSDPAVRQRRHGSVQEHLHRRRDPAGAPRGVVAEVRAGRGQAQRSGQCRLHRAAPDLLRNARQLLLRRLLQGRRDRARLEAGHRRFRPRPRPPQRHRLRHRRRRRGPVAQDRRPAGGADHPHQHLGQLLDHGRQRTLWSVFGDLLRPWPERRRRPARLPRRGRRPLRRDLEPGLHAIRAGGGGNPPRPAAPVDRHRHGPGARRDRAAGRSFRVRDGPVPYTDRRRRVRGRQACPGRRRRLVPRHRRPSALDVVSDRRRG